MRIIGVNFGTTNPKSNKLLRDGGAALLFDDHIELIVLEERISRNKREGGYATSLPCLLTEANLEFSDIGCIGISSCCESLPDISRFVVEKIAVKPVNHHLSHAIGTFALSPFEEALVVVADAGGNTFGVDCEKWWHSSREQNSYFRVTRKSVELIDRDFFEPYEAGMGEVFRAFTCYLGWNSSQHAGKTMALAAYGDKRRFEHFPIFDFSNGRLRCHVRNDPSNPLSMVEQLLSRYGINNIIPRACSELININHADLAAWIQCELEKALICKIEWLCRESNLKNICIAGGVAYNCKMNGELSKAFSKENFYVQPGSGDHGQCLGNAVFCSYIDNGIIPKYQFQPYLGLKDHSFIIEDILSQNPNLRVVCTDNVIRFTAELLANGAFVCRFDGRSEFGPRALGNRSILADPRNVKNKWIMNKVKSREPFMPFAPSVLKEFACNFFEDIASVNYMTTAVSTVKENRKLIPAVVHKDGTSRIHLVDKCVSPRYHELISEFYEITGIPMLMNTSFNRRGEPIVESCLDAIECFNSIMVDYLVMNGVIFEKTIKSKPCNKYNNKDNIDQCVVSGAYNKVTHYKIVDSIGLPVKIRDKFNLYYEYVNWLHYGRKTTTIRFKNGEIDFPATSILPMYETKDFAINFQSDTYVGDAVINNIVIKRYEQLSIEDAVNDGFDSLDELKMTLENIYGKISNSDLLTIYHIYLNS